MRKIHWPPPDESSRRRWGVQRQLVSLPPLGELKQRSGKLISVWCVRGDFDPAGLRSNSFTLEWPPKSGRYQEFPEIDRAEWFDVDSARRKLVAGQVPFIDLLVALTE